MSDRYYICIECRFEYEQPIGICPDCGGKVIDRHDEGNYMHVYYGYSKHKRDDGEECFRCGATPEIMAYTYFGGPLCKECWDGYWIKDSEDGTEDPPFDEINRESSGEYVEIPDGLLDSLKDILTGDEE